MRLVFFDFIICADIVMTLTKLISSLDTIFPIFPSDDDIEFLIRSLLTITARGSETGVQV